MSWTAREHRAGGWEVTDGRAVIASMLTEEQAQRIAAAGPQPLVVPFIHMTGTSAEELLELRETLYGAIDKAVSALKQMAPNGRDYYPDPGRMEKAQAQHWRRMRALTDLMRELESECSEINALKR